MYEKYLEDIHNHEEIKGKSSSEFETKFQSFISDTIESKKNAPILSGLFWTKLNQIIEEKFNIVVIGNEVPENVEKYSNILNNFCKSFNNYWNRLSQSPNDSNLEERNPFLGLVDTIFKRFYFIFLSDTLIVYLILFFSSETNGFSMIS